MDLLQTKGIEKQFLGVKALKGVDFAVKAGEIHALMGENGAGKSTLIKIITGVYPASAGSVYFNGKECKFRSPLDAEHAGISTVYQEVNLLPDLSVAENICIGREPRTKLGFIDKKERKVQARKALARLDIDINVGENLSSYSIAIQQGLGAARNEADSEAEKLQGKSVREPADRVAGATAADDVRNSGESEGKGGASPDAASDGEESNWPYAQSKGKAAKGAWWRTLGRGRKRGNDK